MDLRSGRRLRSRPPPPEHDGAPCLRCGPGADRISSLSDDMINLILARLRCARTAVRTGLLSRRWRGLWTRLTHTDLVFRGVAPARIKAALSRLRIDTVSLTGTEFQLDIHLPSRPKPTEADSVLHAAALLSPAGLVFTIAPYSPDYRLGYYNTIQLPCFQHATSIELDTQLLVVKPRAAGEFLALERLSVCGRIDYIGTLVTRCPRLRVLRAKFRGLERTWIKHVLASLKWALRTREVAVSLIDISISDSEDDLFLLRDAAALAPEEFVYSNSRHAPVADYGLPCSFELPFFHRATSIEINRRGPTFKLPSYSDKFFALERLCLSGCSIANLDKTVPCCPRLRVLRVDAAAVTSESDITVHSTSLEELTLKTYKECCRVDIVAPVLKKLKMELHAGMNLVTPVSTPIVEKVSWWCLYTKPTIKLGFWLLQSLSLGTVESKTELPLAADREDTHFLSMELCDSDGSDVNLNFAQQIERLPVTNFSAVDLRLEAMGHVYGATLLHLLQALPGYDSIKTFKVNLLSSDKAEVTQACMEGCSCNEPNNWRSQSLSLPYLEELEVVGFKAEDHGFDFLKVMLRCAPMLKKVTMKLGKKIKSYAHRGSTKKIYNISLEYPSVNFYVYLGCGTLVLHPCLPCS